MNDDPAPKIISTESALLNVSLIGVYIDNHTYESSIQDELIIIYLVYLLYMKFTYNNVLDI